MIHPRSAAEVGERIATLRQAFADQVPQQFSVLHRLYAELVDAGWTRDRLTPLMARAHELNGSAATFGFNEIADAARQLELALREAQALAVPAAEERRAAIDGLVAKLLSLQVPDPAKLSPLLPPRLDHLLGERKPGQRLIYVVDDNVLVTQQLAEQIHYFGYEVATFNCLSDFASAYREHVPAAVVLDIEFPDEEESGPSVFGRLIHERGESTPVIYISSHDDIHSRLAAARTGSSRYLLKPVSTTELIEAIDGALDSTSPMPYRVLIVDDSHATGQLYAGLLEGAGMKVQVTTNPLKALDILAEFHPDIALIDLYMPECSGQELATVIRQLDAHVSMPIVFLSAETDRKRQMEALQLGADDFITKPVQPQFLIGSVATRAERAREIRAWMQRDPLTGLFNHTSFVDAAAIELSRAKRSNVPAVLVLIDIDGFKELNTRHGYPAGDRLLRSLARQLRQRLRSVDVLGRFGGEEFAVMFNGTDGHTAMRVINAIREDFSRVVHLSDHGSFHATFSAGISRYPDFDDLNALIEAADRGLYEAKRSGRNQVIMGEPLPRENTIPF